MMQKYPDTGIFCNRSDPVINLKCDYKEGRIPHRHMHIGMSGIMKLLLIR